MSKAVDSGRPDVTLHFLIAMSSAHELVREPHPPGKSATPRLQTTDRPGSLASVRKFYTPRAGGGKDKLGVSVLPSIKKDAPSTPYDPRRRTTYAVSDGALAMAQMESEVSIKRVRINPLSDHGLNVGRGRKLVPKFDHNKADDDAESIATEVDAADERRQRLIDSLPAIGNDEKTKRLVAAKLQKMMVKSHETFDQIRQKSQARRKRLKALKNQYADLVQDTTGSGSRSSRGSTTLTARGIAKDPKMLQMTAQLSRYKSKMDDLKEERLSMERMRERMENEWIISVARLKDKRAILQQHDHQDAGLTQDYLNQCRIEKSRAVTDLKETRRQARDHNKKNQRALEDLRLRVSLDINAANIEKEYEEKRTLVVKEQAGDMDIHAEQNLKKRHVITHMKGLVTQGVSDKSWEKRSEIVEKMDRIKQATGGIVDDGLGLDSELLSSRLISRYEELEASVKDLQQQRNDALQRLQEGESEKVRLSGQAETLHEFGIVPSDYDAGHMIGFDARKRKSEDSLRAVARDYQRSHNLVSSTRYMLQTIMVQTGLSNATRWNVGTLTQNDDHLIGLLKMCENHLVQIIGKMEQAKFSTTVTTTSLDMAVMAVNKAGTAMVDDLPVFKENNYRIDFKAMGGILPEVEASDLMNFDVKAEDMSRLPQRRKAEGPANGKNGRNIRATRPPGDHLIGSASSSESEKD